MPVQIESVRVYSDERGIVFEPLEGEKLGGQGNVHVVVSRPGAVRGNHVHARGTETVVVVGPALVRYREEGAVRDVRIPPDEALRFVFPPGVAHAICGTGEGPALLVAFNSLAHDPQRPDTRADILIAEGQ